MERSNSGLQFPPQYKADVVDNVTFIASLIKNCSVVPRLLTLHPGSTPSQSVGKLIKISQEMVSHLRLRRRVEGGGEKKINQIHLNLLPQLFGLKAGKSYKMATEALPVRGLRASCAGGPDKVC